MLNGWKSDGYKSVAKWSSNIMCLIKIGHTGKILSGDSEGFFVKVIDDTQDT